MITMRIMDKTAACTKQDQQLEEDSRLNYNLELIVIKMHCIMELKSIANSVSCYLKERTKYFSLCLIVAQNNAIITLVSLRFRYLFVNV